MLSYLGGYSVGVPPLPIPNREVKPDCADGTAVKCGRAGSRRLFQEGYSKMSSPLFFVEVFGDDQMLYLETDDYLCVGN